MTASARRRDLGLGAAALVGGIMVAMLAARIQGMPGQPLPPGFFPGLVGIFAAVIGAVLLLRAALGHAPPIDAVEDAPAPPMRRAAAWVLAGPLAMIWLVTPLGLLPLLILWLAVFMWLLGVRAWVAVLVAVALVWPTHALFTEVLGVALPPGDLWIDLAGD